MLVAPGRVTDHLGAEPGTRPMQPEPASVAGWNNYPAKAGRVNRHITYQPVSISQCGAGACLAVRTG